MIGYGLALALGPGVFQKRIDRTWAPLDLKILETLFGLSLRRDSAEFPALSAAVGGAGGGC